VPGAECGKAPPRLAGTSTGDQSGPTTTIYCSLRQRKITIGFAGSRRLAIDWWTRQSKTSHRLW